MAHKEKENDALTNLFRTRLAGAEMAVRDGFWESLSQEIPAAFRQRRRLLLYRSVAAASVLLILAAASATFLYFSPRQELEEVFSLVKASQMRGDDAHLHRLPEPLEPSLPNPTTTPHRLFSAAQEEEEDSVDVTFSLSFSFSTSAVTVDGNYASRSPKEYRQASLGSEEQEEENGGRQKRASARIDRVKEQTQHLWALKAMGGMSIPVGRSTYKAPLAAGVTVERKLTEGVGIETGLLYSSLHAATGEHLHLLGIPVRLNVDLKRQDKWQLYATVGGVVDKCVGGAPDNGFEAEPMQLSLTAGVGVRYRVGERLALFAEPGVVHHFHTSSRLTTVRTDSPTHFQMMCGIRMTY